MDLYTSLKALNVHFSSIVYPTQLNDRKNNNRQGEGSDGRKFWRISSKELKVTNFKSIAWLYQVK